MQISQLLKIHKPQKLHLSHAAKRKGYAFNVSHILSNFQKDPFCQPFTSLNELELEKRDPDTLILLSDFLQSHISLSLASEPHLQCHQGEGMGSSVMGRGSFDTLRTGICMAELGLSHLVPPRLSSVTPGRGDMREGRQKSRWSEFLHLHPLPTRPSFSPEDTGKCSLGRESLNTSCAAFLPSCSAVLALLSTQEQLKDACFSSSSVPKPGSLQVWIWMLLLVDTAAEKHKTIPASLPTSASLW